MSVQVEERLFQQRVPHLAHLVVARGDEVPLRGDVSQRVHPLEMPVERVPQLVSVEIPHQDHRVQGRRHEQPQVWERHDVRHDVQVCAEEPGLQDCDLVPPLPPCVVPWHLKDEHVAVGRAPVDGQVVRVPREGRQHLRARQHLPLTQRVRPPHDEHGV
eukprot:763670-Hanusia_phi.AAC.7